MSNIEEYTKNFKFMIPDFNVATWHTEVKENFKAIDALIANFVQSQQYKGAWKQVTLYNVGDLVYIGDKDSVKYGGLYKVLVEHTTSADNFDTYLSQHPEYYKLQGEMGAQEAALRAQDWAEKIDGKVIINESPVDYSSKAYAIGGTGTETNNSKYFKEQAELARDGILLDPGFIAIKTDMLGDENIKTVAENIANVNDVSSNIANILSVYNNLSDINTCSTNMSAIQDAPNQATNAANSALSAAQSAEQAAQSASVSNPPPLLTRSWEDHLLNDIRYLRADTFSWQDGEMYKSAYNHLVEDFTGTTSATETIGSYTITYYLAEDGHKIVLPDMEATVQNIYNESGAAWYYILDTVNQRFKLPRSIHGNVVEKYQDGTSWYRIYSDGWCEQGGQENASETAKTITLLKEYLNTNYSVVASCYARVSYSIQKETSSSISVRTDSSTEYALYWQASGYVSSIPSNDQYKYLYFYVGNYNKSAIEQTAGLNAELFNGKADVDSVMLKENMQVVSELPAAPVDGTYYFVVTDE